MWEEKAYLVTANTHPPPHTQKLSNSIRPFTLFHLLVLNIIDAEGPLLTFSKHLDHEQLCSWLYDHPRFMGVDYRHDIGKLKGIIIILLT